MSNCSVRHHTCRRSSATAADTTVSKGWERAPAATTGQNGANKLLCCHSDGLRRASMMPSSAPLRRLAPSPPTTPSKHNDGSVWCPAIPSYGLVKSTWRPGVGSLKAGAQQRFTELFLQTNNYTKVKFNWLFSSEQQPVSTRKWIVT
jgi:hypothetical protein